MTTIINTGESPGMRSKWRLAERLYAQGTGNEPVEHWTQGLAKLAQAGIGGYQLGQLDREERARDTNAQALLMEAPGMQPPNAAGAVRTEAPPPQAMAAASMPGKVYSQDQLNPIDAASSTGARPGSPVMPSNRVWGDKEAEAAGLYEPTRVASAGPVMVQGGQAPNQVAGPSTAAPAGPSAASQAAPAVMPQSSPQIPPDQAAYIRKLMANRQTRDYGAALYQKAISDASAAVKPTDEIREFEYSRKNPAFKDYKTELKRAGATTNQVMIDQKGEGEFSKESGKIQAKRFGELAEEGPAAKQMISDVETLRTLGAQIGTGKGAAVTAALGPYAKALGVDVGGLDEVQAYEAIIARVAPALRVKGSGAQSDYELKTFLKSLPSLGNTPGGNEITAQVLQGLQENKLRAAEIGARALNGQISRPDAEKALRELPDPMAGYRDFVKRTNPKAAKAQRDIRSKYGLE